MNIFLKLGTQLCKLFYGDPQRPTFIKQGTPEGSIRRSQKFSVNHTDHVASVDRKCLGSFSVVMIIEIGIIKVNVWHLIIINHWRRILVKCFRIKWQPKCLTWKQLYQSSNMKQIRKQVDWKLKRVWNLQNKNTFRSDDQSIENSDTF